MCKAGTQYKFQLLLLQLVLCSVATVKAFPYIIPGAIIFSFRSFDEVIADILTKSEILHLVDSSS